MRRYIIFLLLSLGLSLAAFVVWAQDFQPESSNQKPPSLTVNPPRQMIGGTSEWQPIPARLVDPADFAAPSLTNDAGDSCSAATALTLPGGETSTINSLSDPVASDPEFSCAWGGPTQGYRTAWYQFTAPHNGQVLIDTFGSTYDTILAVFRDVSPDGTDPCTDFSNYMEAAACRDDSNGFTSSLSLAVRKDEVYYVEVADWEEGAGTTKSLRISVLMEPINTNWSQETPMQLARSRHATAVVGNDIYVIGGQKILGSIPDITPQFDRYETDTGQWVTLQNMPGTGYSNTAAAYVDGPDDNGRIYLPSGYNGGSAYDMTHWAYDVQGGYWLTRTAITDVFATTPFAWATAVAVTSPNPGYYVIGGLNTIDPPTSTTHVRNEMYFYAPAIDSWLQHTSMSDARYAHTAALVNGKVCVVGGIKHDGVNSILLADGECYTQGVGWAQIAAMNYPRYSAGSAVGPDGKWYVFGGFDSSNDTVSETEVYDPATNTWSVLDINHDLGGSATLPARAWPRGGVVGSRLWAIGGHNNSQQPLSLVESLFIPTDNQFLPVAFSNFGDNNRPDDHFGVARPLALNVAQYRNFDASDDYFDVYYFELSALTAVTVKLTQVPSDSDYNIAIYDDNKLLWGEGNNLQGLNETVPLTLSAGRYYIVVERVWPAGDPNTANYRLIVEQ